MSNLRSTSAIPAQNQEDDLDLMQLAAMAQEDADALEAPAQPPRPDPMYVDPVLQAINDAWNESELGYRWRVGIDNRAVNPEFYKFQQ